MRETQRKAEARLEGSLFGIPLRVSFFFDAAAGVQREVTLILHSNWFLWLSFSAPIPWLTTGNLDTAANTKVQTRRELAFPDVPILTLLDISYYDIYLSKNVLSASATLGVASVL